MRSIGPNEIKFELQIIQIYKKKKKKKKWNLNSPIDDAVTQTVFIPRS